jgi:hypothetical protein
MTLHALVPDSKWLKLGDENPTASRYLITGCERVTNGTVGVSIRRGQNLPIGVKQAKVGSAVAHTLNPKKDSELLIDVFAHAICGIEAENDGLRGNAYLL